MAGCAWQGASAVPNPKRLREVLIVATLLLTACTGGQTWQQTAPTAGPGSIWARPAIPALKAQSCSPMRLALRMKRTHDPLRRFILQNDFAACQAATGG
jgi:hypothetical protein